MTRINCKQDLRGRDLKPHDWVRWISKTKCDRFLSKWNNDVFISTSDGPAGFGTGGSSYNPGSLDYPGVPYGPYDFNGKGQCGTASGNIENYGVRNGITFDSVSSGSSAYY